MYTHQLQMASPTNPKDRGLGFFSKEKKKDYFLPLQKEDEKYMQRLSDTNMYFHSA